MHTLNAAFDVKTIEIFYLNIAETDSESVNQKHQIKRLESELGGQFDQCLG